MKRYQLMLGVCLLTATCSSDDDAPRRPDESPPSEGGAGPTEPGESQSGAGAGAEPTTPDPAGGAPGASGNAGAPEVPGGASGQSPGGVGGSPVGEGGGGGEPPVVPDDGCSSKLYYVPDGLGSEGMNPGLPCLACHAVSSGTSAPNLVFAGTIYPTAIEPNLCVAVASAGAEVVLLDASAVEHRVTVNGAGNFLGRSGLLTAPYSAKVVFQGRERVAQTPHTNGDCNGCHSTGARIRLPTAANDM